MAKGAEKLEYPKLVRVSKDKKVRVQNKEEEAKLNLKEPAKSSEPPKTPVAGKW